MVCDYWLIKLVTQKKNNLMVFSRVNINLFKRMVCLLAVLFI